MGTGTVAASVFVAAVRASGPSGDSVVAEVAVGVAVGVAVAAASVVRSWMSSFVACERTTTPHAQHSWTSEQTSLW